MARGRVSQSTVNYTEIVLGRTFSTVEAARKGWTIIVRLCGINLCFKMRVKIAAQPNPGYNVITDVGLFRFLAVN